MKRKTAKEILAESLKELAAIRDIEKITIKEITDNCGYSPATFYRQFKDKYDLIAWDYAKEVEQNIGKIGRDGHTWKQALLVSAKYNIKKQTYAEYRQARQDMKDYQTAKYNVEQFLRKEEEERQAETKKRTEQVR